LRKIAATYIFPVSSPPLKNGILVVDDYGKILDIRDTHGNLREEAGLEYYSGIVVPGFVNAHCHLEFSGLRNRIPRGTGLPSFLGYVQKLRDQDVETRQQEAEKADREMQQNGIVAVGDVSNGCSSLAVKKKSALRYYTFIEVFGFLPQRAKKAFAAAEKVYQACRNLGLEASIVPHSPYSVSRPLFEKIKMWTEKNQGVISMHNQESSEENFFFKTGRGGIATHMKHTLGLDLSGWKPPGRNSLVSVVDQIPEKARLLLVHNTFTTKEDVQELKKKRDMHNVFFILCPGANQYISHCLPPADMLREQQVNLCLGTDSLASNRELSILAEMKILQHHFPQLELEELIAWGTLHGAKALGTDGDIGSFEPGKKPGVNLLVKTDLQSLKLTPETKCRKLV
jgi:aminodeoxyfutalosine deaminase